MLILISHNLWSKKAFALGSVKDFSQNGMQGLA